MHHKLLHYVDHHIKGSWEVTWHLSIHAFLLERVWGLCPLPAAAFKAPSKQPRFPGVHGFRAEQLSDGAQGLPLGCWGYQWEHLWRSCRLGCCGACPVWWISASRLSNIGCSYDASSRMKASASPSFRRRGREFLMRFQPLVISVSVWALWGCAFLVTHLYYPGKNNLLLICTEDDVHRALFGTHGCYSDGFAQMHELAEKVFSLPRACSKGSVVVFSTWLPLGNRHLAPSNAFLSPLVSSAVWR